ncbi:MAG: CheR family methyltransferase [Elusimicrobiota bacterium]
MNINEEAIEFLKNHISKSAGIRFRKDRSITRAVEERIKKCGFKSLHEYYRHIKFHPEGSVELRELVSLITINKSSFFRDECQYRILRKDVLPEIVNSKLRRSVSNPYVSIWSAGCSTGEEPYSIAIEMLDRFRFLKKQWEIEILGTDVDKTVLKKAMKAEYAEKRLAGVSDKRKKKYFERNGDLYRLKDEVRSLCSFDYQNLMEEPYPHSYFGKWDIIFCKNVFIYFDKEDMRKVIERFSDVLNEDGFLFLGHSESLYLISNDFLPVQFEDAFLYKKKKITQEPAVCEKPDLPEKPQEKLKVIKKEKEKENEFNLAYEKYKNEYYDEACCCIEKHIKENDSKDLKSFLLAAKIYFEKNDPGRALSYALKAVRKSELNPEAYLIIGAINKNLMLIDEAEKYLRKALFLKPDFGLASFKLAHLFEETQQIDKAIQEYRNTILSFKKCRKDEPVELAGGFTVKTLMEHAENRIRCLKNRS